MAKIKLDAKLRKQIRSDWMELFPSLGVETKDQIGRRVGPILLSIWLEKMRSDEVYRPRFSVSPICNNYEVIGAHLCAIPDISINFLSYREHQAGKYKYAAETLRQNALVPIEGPVTLSKVIEAYKFHICHQPWQKGEKELQDPALIAGWAGRPDIGLSYLDWSIEKYRWVNSVMEERLEKAKERNDADDIERYTKILAESDVDAWYKRISTLVKDQKTLQDYTEKHVERMKLQKLPYEDLIIDL